MRSRFSIAITVLLMGSASAEAAASAPASAVVTPQEVIAGTPNLNFSVNVYNPLESQGGNGPVDVVRVSIPEHGSRLLFEPKGAEAAGWTPSIGGGVISFRGGSIPNGNAVAFRVTADVVRPEADISGTWRVEVSRDGGQSFEPAVPTSYGLGTLIRTLEIGSLELIAPDEAADRTVSEGQTGACARMTVRNEASLPASVATDFAGERITPGPSQAKGAVPCSGEVLGSGMLQIPAGDSGEVEVLLGFGSAGVTALTAAAHTQASRARDRALTINIEPAPDPGYVEGTLKPSFVQPGKQSAPVLSVEKSAGTPALTFDAERSFLEIEGCPLLDLATGFEMAVGASTLQLRFEPCEISGPDGGRFLRLTLGYVDANGAPGAINAQIIDQLVVDGFLPSIQAQLTLPESQFPGQASALKNGDVVEIEGEVRDRVPESGELEPCDGCDVEIQIRSFSDRSCTSQLGSPNAMPVGVSEGSFSAGGAVSFPPGALGARFVITARDQAGNSGSTSSSCVEVDNEPPRILTATTTTIGGTPRAGVLVTLNECVTGATSLLDWRIGSLPPAAVAQPSCTNGIGTVLLTSLTQLSSADPAGMLTYGPLPEIGGRLFDRVGHVVAAASLEIRQG